MKIIKPSHTYMTHDCTPMQFIERIGRTCYKSTDKISDGSAEKFVDNLIKRKHWAMLEHENIYIQTSPLIIESILTELHILNIDYSFLHISMYDGVFSGNITAFCNIFKKIDESHGHLYSLWAILANKYSWVFNKLDNKHLNDSFVPKVYFRILENTTIYSRDEFIDEYKDNADILFKHLTHTVKFVCDRGVSHEIVRHRPCSFAQESTRYCNYSQDKFGREITVILPCFFDTGMGTASNSFVYDTWKHSCEVAEESYFKLLDYGAKPQEARDVLPNSLKTEIIMTATEEEWQHIVNLRSKGTTGAPHPQMVEIMTPCFEELKQITNGRIS